jgi:hypothetical protein
VLGESRHAELARARTPQMKGLFRLVERLGLPRERAAQAYELQAEAVRELRRLEQDGSLSADDKQAAAEALRAGTEAALFEALGQEGLESLKGSGKMAPGLRTDPSKPEAP